MPWTPSFILALEKIEGLEKKKGTLIFHDSRCKKVLELGVSFGYI